MLKMKLKKIIACICIVFILSSVFVIPDVTVINVSADVIIPSGSMEFDLSRAISTLLAKIGVSYQRVTVDGSSPPTDDQVVRTYMRTVIRKKYGYDPKDNLLNDEHYKEFLYEPFHSKINILSNYLLAYAQDVVDGYYDDTFNSSELFPDTIKNAVDKFNNFNSSINKSVKLEHQGDINKRYLYYVSKQVAPTLDDSTRWAFDSWRDELVTLENHFSNVDAGYFFQNTIYVGIKTVAINKGEYGFFYYDNVKKNLVGYSLSGHVYQFDHLTYDGQDRGGYNFYDLPANLQSGTLNDKAGFNHDDIWTNMSFRVFEDGSILLFDPALIMSSDVFTGVQNSLWDVIQNSGYKFTDFELADSSGVAISDPSSKFVDETVDSAISVEDMQKILDGTESLEKYAKKSNAINKKTGETVGEISQTLDDSLTAQNKQVGILGNIYNFLTKGLKNFLRIQYGSVLDKLKVIDELLDLSRIFKVNIDNVGDLTNPIALVVSLLSNGLGVSIDNVADVTNPISTSIDTLNGNVSNLLSSFGNAILNAIDDIQTADLSDVIAGIKAVPKSIADSFAQPFESVNTAIAAVSTTVGDLFAPPPVALTDIYNKGNNILDTHFGMPKAAFKTFLVEGKEVPDVKYKVGNKEYTVIPFSYFNKFVDKFRIYIQTSFVFIWIVWFANQVLALFDKSAIISGHISDIGRGER